MEKFNFRPPAVYIIIISFIVAFIAQYLPLATAFGMSLSLSQALDLAATSSELVGGESFYFYIYFNFGYILEIYAIIRLFVTQNQFRGTSKFLSLSMVADIWVFFPVLVVLIGYLSASSEASYIGNFFSFGIGFYLALIAGIVIFISILVINPRFSREVRREFYILDQERLNGQIYSNNNSVNQNFINSNNSNINIANSNNSSVFCTKCGKENPSNAKFCVSCGNPLRK